MTSPDNPRREFIKRSVYVAPVVVTLTAAPSFAKAGSEKPYKEPTLPKQPKTKK
jgi:hypothetical protein